MSAAAGATAEPLLLIGASRREVLRAALLRCVESWRQRWSTAREPISIAIADEAAEAGSRHASSGAALLVGVSATHGEIIYLRCGPEIMGALLGSTMTGAGGVFSWADTTRELALELYLEIVRSLCADLLKLVEMDDVSIRHTSAASSKRQRCLVAKVVFAGVSASIDIDLTARLVELLAPRKAHTAVHDLARKRLAIVDETVRIEAMLGEAEISLGDLAQLTEGDVVVLNQSLSSSGYLAMPDGRRVADVALGSSGAQRAISVVK